MHLYHYLNVPMNVWWPSTCKKCSTYYRQIAKSGEGAIGFHWVQHNQFLYRVYINHDVGSFGLQSATPSHSLCNFNYFFSCMFCRTCFPSKVFVWWFSHLITIIIIGLLIGTLYASAITYRPALCPLVLVRNACACNRRAVAFVLVCKW